MKKAKPLFSVVRIFVALGILFCLNLVAGQLNIRADLTQDKLYSISDQTKEILDTLEQDVSVYPLFPTAQNDEITDNFREILNQYSNYSKHVLVAYKDPVQNPGFALNFAQDGTSIAEGSIIVTNGTRTRVIGPTDLVSVNVNPQTYQQELESVNVEPQVSNAIAYVVATSSPTIVAVTGHDEVPLPEAFLQQLRLANFNIGEMDLFKETIATETTNLLVVTTPAKDWTPEEAAKVSDYLASGGRALFLMDAVGTPLTNVNKVLGAYGVGLGNAYVVEGNSAQFIDGSPLNLLPLVTESMSTELLGKKSMNVVLQNAQGIVTTDTGTLPGVLDTLLVTSNDAYAKTSPTLATINKEEGDTNGPFNLAVGITSEQPSAPQTKVVVVGNSYILDESVNEYVGGDNYAWLMAAINWTQDAPSTTYIAPKASTLAPLQMSNLNVMSLAFVSVILLPLGLIGTGFVVWFKRRHN